METKLIICPTTEKERILSKNQNEDLVSIKFMTKEEFFQNYFFSYNQKTIAYLIKKYGYDIDVIKVYLENMKYIEDEKEYHHPKLIFLQELKNELKRNNLLQENKYFKEYIKDKTIIVKNYGDLEKIEEKILGYHSQYKMQEISKEVYHFETLEEEVSKVAEKIVDLIKQGISIHHIFLTNVQEDYYYTIKRIFRYYHIPINLKEKSSLFSTNVGKKFYKTRTLDLESVANKKINQKILTILKDLIEIENQDIVDQLLEYELKHTYILEKEKKEAVNIKDFYQDTFEEDDYVFVLSMNQDILPAMEKDIFYITDSMKDEVELYTTDEKNKRKKEQTIEILSKLKHGYLSFKERSPFHHYYMSSLIKECNLEVKEDHFYDNKKSNLYNKIILGKKLDQYYLYGEITQELVTLRSHYDILYQTYQNQFNGISRNTYLEQLKVPLRLSYTSLNTYNECKFKYYIKYVLKLETFTDTFASIIGSMYHEILSLYNKSKFNLVEEINRYLETHELSLKEKLLMVKIRKDLEELFQILKEQETYTEYQEILTEKKVVIPLRTDIQTEFIGYIDKILFYKNLDDTYYSIIDYKSGTIDTSIEPLKYGLHMQLPIYLYLMNYGKVFDNPIFTGIYYQNILFSYPKWEKDLEKKKKNQYKLVGYSTDKIDILSRFDNTVEKSSYIKSMSYKDEKFGTYAKTMSEEELYQMVKYTKNIIMNKTDEILQADFKINPKFYDKENISCKYCTFHDLCYVEQKDIIYYDKVEDLSFLEEE